MPSKEQKKKVKKLFLYIFTGYLILVLGYLLFRGSLETLLRQNFSPDFSVSFSSALAENLFFYLFGLPIAYFSIVLSLADPKEGSFETRLKSLANSSMIVVDDKLYEYLKRNVTNYLIYNKTTALKIEIREYNPEFKAYYIWIKIDMITTNMCKENDFISTPGHARVIPDFDIKGEYGMVGYLGTYNPKTGKKTDVASAQKILKKFETEFELPIPQNGELGSVFDYAVWNRAGIDKDRQDNWYFVDTKRYTRTVEFSVCNRLEINKIIKYDIRYYNSQTKELISLVTEDQIAPKGEKQIPIKFDLYPQDRLELFVYE